MKKLKLIIISLIALIILPISASAASATVKVTGSSQVVVGNNITVTVTLSSSTAIGSWELDLDYNKNYLELVSTTSEGGGTRMVNASTTGVKSKSYTFVFKAKKTGSTTLKVGTYDAYAYNDMSQMSITSTGKTVKIITQAELEASYSTDNNLKSLTVEGYEISPEFSSDVTEYTVTVPENTTSITIGAEKNDSAATVTGTGTVEVTQGTNKFEIVVRAENGSEKTYTLTVEVVDPDPIEVSVGDEDYTVVKISEYLPQVNAYTETTIDIDGYEIPAYTSDITGFTLVGLKDSNGDISLYIYDIDNNSYTLYIELVSNQLTIYPMETDKTLEGYEYGTVTINGVEVNAYYVSSDSRYVIIYGINVETGEEGFYKYDKTDQSFQKYDDEMINDLLEKNKLYSYIIIGFSAILVIMFIILIANTRKGKKKQSKERKDKSLLSDEAKINKLSSEKKDDEDVKIEKTDEVIDTVKKTDDIEKNSIVEISNEKTKDNSLEVKSNNKKKKKKKKKK